MLCSGEISAANKKLKIYKKQLKLLKILANFIKIVDFFNFFVKIE